ncbi:SNAP25 homologous protein SNAP33 isoform X1 [Arachis stenosperma]|uniref:SNAP25 homologous protein SNAP33 isoform X1 n=1 Tax=Arachis stenosperma TaxID=217475 RepID=UPI0025ACC8DB|nr:SNAP25 homologous protein SNAP33 isoform X1 [Arachis stenosperma]
MFGSKKSPLKAVKPSSADPAYHVKSGSNPFDSDDEANGNRKYNSARKSDHHALVSHEVSTNPFDVVDTHGHGSSSSYAYSSADRNRYKNDFRDTGGLESQSVQELENYAVYKAEETTKSVKNSLKIAEEIREDATKTLVMLHQQGEQITRSHNVAVDIDQDLSRGEKLLGSLGGMFSKTWKPKKPGTVKGPVVFRDDPVRTKGSHLEQKEKLGLTSASKGQSRTQKAHSEPTNALEKVEVCFNAVKVEHGKQDDALSDLSDLLGELKGMAIDMGSEIDIQNKALDGFETDADMLNIRMNGANQRGRHLLRK